MFFENKGKISSFKIQKLNLSPADITKRNDDVCSSGRRNKTLGRSSETQGVIKHKRQW